MTNDETRMTKKFPASPTTDGAHQVSSFGIRHSGFDLTRRDLLTRAGVGFGGIALADMLSRSASASEGGLPGLPHFAPKAKRVIFLFMSGGPSQFESFDYKPMLNKRMGEDFPQSLRNGKALPGMSGAQSAF